MKPDLRCASTLLRVVGVGSIALSTMASTGCGSSKPTSQPPLTGPGFAQNLAETHPGTKVVVERRGQWLAATIVQRVGTDLFQVRFDGYGAEWDEVVGPDRMRPATGAAEGADASTTFSAGETVLVSTPQGGLHLATVQQSLGATAYRVRYDGFNPEVLEEVESGRLRRPHPAGDARFALGTEVGVDANGTPARARVVALVAPGEYLLRFEQAGPGYDRVFPESALTGAAVVSGDAPPSPPAVADGKPPPPTPPPSKSAPLAAGDAVLVEHRGAYHPATVVKTGGAITVRYAEASSTEEVAAARVVRAPADKEAGMPYAPKEAVFIEWHGLYFKGEVLKKTGPGQYKVRFQGTGPAEDEIVVSRRLRPAS